MIIDTVSSFPANPTPPMSLIQIIGDTSIADNNYINEYSAMTAPAFYSGITFIASTFGTFGMGIYQDDGQMRGMVPHPVNRILRRRSSAFATPFNTIQTWMHHALIWGNGYLWVKRQQQYDVLGDYSIAKGGDPVALLNLNPEITIPFLYKGQKFYFCNFERPVVLAAEDVLHIRLIGFDGIRGYPLVQMMRNSLKVGKSAERYSARYFEKGTFTKGAIQVPGNLTDAQFNSLRDSLRQFRGTDSDNSLEYMVLQAGATVNNLSAVNETAQLIETRKWSVVEVCQMLRVPPHILFELSHGKWSSVEQMGAEVVKYTFSPWIIQAEQEMSAKLLSEDEQDAGLFVRINTDSLERADKNALAQTVMQQVNGGIISLNEGRALLDLPPRPDGDQLRIPVSFPTAPNGGENTTTGIQGPAVDDPGATDANADPDGMDPPPPTDDADNGIAVQQALPGLNVIDPNARPASYQQIIAPILLDACARVDAKTDRAFSNREGKEIFPWANVFSEQQHKYVLDALKPIQEVATQFGQTVDAEKIATKYALAIRKRASTGEVSSLDTIAREVMGEAHGQ